jgi:hypothetical protein
VYNVVRDLKSNYGLTHWQAVIFGMQAIVYLGSASPTAFKALVDKIKTDYPDSPGKTS